MDETLHVGQEAFDELIAEILSRLASAISDEVDAAILASLRQIAESAAADYAFVVRTSSELSHWSVDYEWCGPTAPSQIANYQNVAVGSWDWSEQVLLAGEVLLLNRLDELPPAAADVRRRMHALGFKSTLQVPTRGPGGQVSGCIAICSLVREMHWARADVGRLRLVGAAIADAIERARMEKSLRHSEGATARRSAAALRHAHEELERRRALLVAASLDGVWEWKIASHEVQYSARFAELLGYTADEVPQTLDFFRGIIHPEDAEAVWSALQRHLEGGTLYDAECRLQTKGGAFRWFRTRGIAQRDADAQPTWMAGALQDIDPQKTAEQGLRNALAEVQRLTERLRAENLYLQEEITHSLGFDEIVGQSASLRGVLRQIEHVATTDASVLLLGETGTGKELLARAIHDRSLRKERPLVKVNLAALPATLIESELFGHVKGAFTGALADKVGRFQLADGGTLFLDEIGELDPDLQTKLLRVLQEGEFERIGSVKTQKVNVRIVSATNRDLRSAMEHNQFRLDLYYRLAVFPIDVPPLRKRTTDLPLLTWHFIAKKQGRLGKTIENIPAHVMQALQDYDWPGNIRELENVIERAMILTTGPSLRLPEPLLSKTLEYAPRARPRSSGRDEVVRSQILAALEASDWKIKGAGNAADRLGLKPSTLRYRMNVFGIERPRPE